MDSRRILTVGLSWMAAALALKLAAKAIRFAERVRPRLVAKWRAGAISL